MTCGTVDKTRGTKVPRAGRKKMKMQKYLHFLYGSLVCIYTIPTFW